MIRPILKHPSKVLYARCQEVDLHNPPPGLFDDLMDTFKFNSNAAGLAAPQIGLPWRAAIVRIDGKATMAVNPYLKWASGIHVVDEEGCLSMPWLKVKVGRHNSIVACFRSVHNEEMEFTLYGFEGRVFQHELDHLDGITLETHRRRKAA